MNIGKWDFVRRSAGRAVRSVGFSDSPARGNTPLLRAQADMQARLKKSETERLRALLGDL